MGLHRNEFLISYFWVYKNIQYCFVGTRYLLFNTSKSYNQATFAENIDLSN